MQFLKGSVQCHIQNKFVVHESLRLMVFVNTSDYLPTKEATGVRIAIHGQRECPFPDTFGYSAPTGAVSSFEMSLVRMLF
ncbi:unnamed protein product [Strongylus vulgaris]|uniref:Uncharacterized protein n=1 Tax=Strongylus vulgaris TaxID=40348 RepID=A0A3P7JJ67_STRVU|nr:unnamed protein product [Strongylus vulgaris]